MGRGILTHPSSDFYGVPEEPVALGRRSTQQRLAEVVVQVGWLQEGVAAGPALPLGLPGKVARADPD